MWSATAGLVAALVSGVVGIAAAVGGRWPVLPLVVLPSVVLAVGYQRVAWSRRTWRLGDVALELRRGVVVDRAVSIPYHRIQQIDVESGPIDRMIGLCRLLVRTAAATTDAAIPGLELEDATRIRTRLLILSGIDDAV